MGPKTAVHLRIITSLVLVTVGTHQQQTSSNSALIASKLGRKRTITNNVDNQVSRSVFVPSFGPPVPPSDYLQFDPSLVTNYHGFPYAGTYSYNKYTTPFVPSPRDYFLDALQQLPVPQARQSYAEGYLHHYQPQARSEVVPSKPHVFQNVVNYGNINIHHGDHQEPHDNGKPSTAAAHPPEDRQQLQHLAFSLPFHQGYTLPLQQYYNIHPLPSYPGLSTEQTQEPEDSAPKGESAEPGTESLKNTTT